MSAIAPKQQISAKDICKDVRDIDNYVELEVDSAATNIIVLKKDRLNAMFPAQERLLVNVKTRTYYHLKIQVTRAERGDGNIREEISLTVNNKEFYFSSVSNKSKGLQSSDLQSLNLTSEVKESLNTCCKWCGVPENRWTECVRKLDVLGEFAGLFDLCLVLEKRRAEERQEATLTPKNVQKGGVVGLPKEKEAELKSATPAKCLHNEVSCPHTLKKRCFTCKKKVGMNGFNCDCQKVFCGVHQAPLKQGDDLEHGHLCQFDHKGQAQQKLLDRYAEVLDN